MVVRRGGRNSNSVIFSGIFLLVLLVSTWIILEVKIDLGNNVFATLNSKNNVSIESSNATNTTSAAGTNGSISIITPQELQDRRHAAS